MATPLLATKLYRPVPRPNAVLRPRLIEQLNAGLHRKLTLIAAPAGFGKSTLLSAWLAGCDRPAAWLSLDDGDSGYLPRLVGVLLLMASVCYLIQSFGNILFPAYSGLFTAVGLLSVVDIALPVWLLIKGVNVEQWEQL